MSRANYRNLPEAKSKVGKMRATQAAQAAGKPKAALTQVTQAAEAATKRVSKPQTTGAGKPKVGKGQAVQDKQRARAASKVDRMRTTQAAGKAGKAKANKKKPSRMGRLGKAAASLSGDLNAPDDSFGQQHQEAVSIGRDVQQKRRASQPGRAQAIIKNRRV